MRIKSRLQRGKFIWRETINQFGETNNRIEREVGGGRVESGYGDNEGEAEK